MTSAFEAWIEKARAVPIEKVIEQRGIKLGGGVDRCGPCPVCGGTDRFSINVKKQVFNCRGCNLGGDVIKLTEHLDQIDFIRACETLVGEPPPKTTVYAEITNIKPATSRLRSANGHNTVTARKTVPPSAKQAEPESRVVATYAYRNADGEVLYEVVRREPKSFQQRRPLPGGGYSYSLGDVQPVLYRLPELNQFPSGTIWVTEGEKDADRLASLDLLATTISGSTKWTAELAEPLRGRDIVVLIDNDEAGFAKADKAGQALSGVAKSVRLLLLPGLPPRGDVSDWLNAGHRKEELEQAALDARLWKPREEKIAEQAAAEAEEPLGEWDAGLDDVPVPPRGWLLGNSFCRGYISSVIAEGGVGKSALRLAQLMSLAVGRPLTGEHVFMRCRALLLSLEDDKDEVRRRLRAACLHHGIEPSELQDWLFLAAPGMSGGKLMLIDAHGRSVKGKLASKLARVIEERKIDIVSVDPFVKCHNVPENDNGAIDQVVQVLVELAAQYNVAVDVPHHAAKGPADPGNANRGRGASAMKDAGRLVYTLTPMSLDEAKVFGLDELERRRLVRLDSAKVNITPPWHEAKWFRLVGVNIGNQTDLYPSGDQVQTVERWTPPNIFTDLNTLTINQILTEIDAGLPDGNRYTDAPNAVERAAWPVIAKHCEGKSEPMCRRIIKLWLDSGLLTKQDYENPITRKSVNGLWVDNAKRPT
ncbi:MULTISPECIES: AAA family ATPase [unclassified Bradyrhizobium]|uniref:AAA family ATPase n=1 Tax=unclassified Bradyrhizobium TaxID=2631580 RepID=UPI002FEE6E4C